MTVTDQIVRHLLENEEDDDFDQDVGIPVPLEGFLQKRGFEIAVPPDLGYDKIFNRGSSRLRVGHMDRDEGARKVEFYSGGTVLWTKYLTDEEVLEMIDRNSRIGEAEEEDFGDDDWKDVTPQVPAASIERWCFTDFEMKKPTMCNGTDEFLADGDAELAVIVLRNGTVTDRWEDGTTGVPPHCAQMADLDESPINPGHRRQMFNEEDHYADNWRDVYVDKSGKFLGFVVRESEDFDDDDFVDTAEAGAPTIQHLLRTSGFQERERDGYFIKEQGGRQFMVWPSVYDAGTWYLHTYKKNDRGVWQQDTQQVTADPNEFLGWLRAFKLVQENEDFEDEDYDIVKDVSSNSLVDEVKRDFVRALTLEEYGDSRTLVKDCLVRLGVPWANASLIALEQGSSQAYVARKYLSDVGLRDDVLENAAKFIKFVYTLQTREGAREHYAQMFGNE